jgi:hypothetical protein
MAEGRKYEIRSMWRPGDAAYAAGKIGLFNAAGGRRRTTVHERLGFAEQ